VEAIFGYSFESIFKSMNPQCRNQIRFDPNISDHGDLAIPHTIVGVKKLFKLFYTIHYYIFCGIFMTK
jgi:hypothetical protein